MHFVAHSIAGRMALEAAIARPDLFATLVLEEPAGGISAPGVAPTPGTCDLEGLDPAERQLCIFVNQRSGPGYYEALSEPYRQYLYDNLRPAVDLDADSFPSICDALGRLTMPILFVRGADTPLLDQSRLDSYEACLPAHETAVIPGAAHTPHMDAPDAFNKAIVSFFDRHPL